MVDQDEGGEDDPVKLVDQPEIWASVLHQAVVGVEDEEGTEKYVEEHGRHVHISCSEPSLNNGWAEGWKDGMYLDKNSTKEASVVRVFKSKSKPAVSQKGNRTADSWKRVHHVDIWHEKIN